jgi:hypothetical protein
MSTSGKYAIFTIGLALFSYLVYSYGFANIYFNLQRTGWWFLPIVLVWAVVYYCNALAWFVILRDHYHDLRFGKIFRLSITAFALNYVTPFLSLGGEPYRTVALNNTVDTHRAVSSVILYNMIRWLAHFFFWLSAIVAMLFTISLTPGTALSLGLLWLVLCMSIWFFVTRHKYGIFESLLSWLSRMPLLRRSVEKLQPYRTTLLVIDDQIRQLYAHHRLTFYTSAGLEYVSRLIASYEFYFILKALGYDPTYLEAFYINAATSFILNMFFFVPFELGTREGGLLLIMQSLAYPPGIGIFIALVNRLREFVWILIGMGLMLISDQRPPHNSLMDLIEHEHSI